MRRFTCAAAALATATALLSVQSADAEGLGGSHGVRYARSTVTIPATTGEPTVASAVATCPRGWMSVGGGHTIRAGAGRGIAAGMKLSHRKWSAKAWQGDSADTSLTTYAVCIRNAARCPRRTRPSTTFRRAPCRWTSQAPAPAGAWSAAE